MPAFFGKSFSPSLFLFLSLAASFAAKTTFSVEPREFSMLTARCLATLPAEEIREQKVQVGSGVGGGEGGAASNVDSQ